MGATKEATLAWPQARPTQEATETTSGIAPDEAKPTEGNNEVPLAEPSPAKGARLPRLAPRRSRVARRQTF